MDGFGPSAVWKIDGLSLCGSFPGRGAPTFLPPERDSHRLMRGVFSQIVIGIIVTVIGTVIANAVVGSGRHHFLPGIHYSGSSRR
ncbi:hypothetical protein HYPDE_29078 [Hyphomicrobium denitrificans 1NES1]|uniref:Uncharacterized protein n=1 Tax=Hyphomicrobium denitrificans 1NES1 TaxID=670307 RepID=N0B204_9HYPH|nr:hypothetical protein HYPDE_29078 [Hyphomicrobium denitrificans 1NES1]